MYILSHTLIDALPMPSDVRWVLMGVITRRLGVIVEVNCETDFVARGDVFKQLAADMAMQVAACPQVTVVDTAQVPADVVEKERNVQLGKEDIIKKPENIRSAFPSCPTCCAELSCLLVTPPYPPSPPFSPLFGSYSAFKAIFAVELEPHVMSFAANLFSMGCAGPDGLPLMSTG